MDRLLSEDSIKAISNLGEGVSFDDDVRPALAAVGIEPTTAQSSVRSSADYIAVYVPRVRDHLERTLASLDLSDSEIVSKTLRAAVRIARVFAANVKADKAALMRLANALGDDAQRIEADLARNEQDAADAVAYSDRTTSMGKSNVKVTINRAAIARMMRDIQREFDKHPITVPVNADASTTHGATNVYNGPVIHGTADGAQLAWGNKTVHQTQQRSEQVTPGFEILAQAVAKTLEGLSSIGLPEDDHREAEATGHEILEEMTQPQPDKGRIRRGLLALKGFLAPVATGLSDGAAEGAQEWARTAIEQLGATI